MTVTDSSATVRRKACVMTCNRVFPIVMGENASDLLSHQGPEKSSSVLDHQAVYAGDSEVTDQPVAVKVVIHFPSCRLRTNCNSAQQQHQWLRLLRYDTDCCRWIRASSEFRASRQRPLMPLSVANARTVWKRLTPFGTITLTLTAARSRVVPLRAATFGG